MASASSLPAAVRRLLPSIHNSDHVWLVGGAVRDQLLGIESYDLDFVVDGDALACARRLADSLGGSYFPLDLERETGRAILPSDGDKRLTCDFARMRGADIHEDLQSRDFTVNALAIHLHPPFDRLDPLGGAADLRAGRLRACSASSLADDPVRTLRAIRLAIQFELKIEPETLESIKGAARLLAHASSERKRDELFSILDGDHPGRAMRLMDHLDLLLHTFPELTELKGRPLPEPVVYEALDYSLSIAARLEQLLSVLEQEHDPESAAEITLAQIALRLGRYREQISRCAGSVLSAERRVRSLLFFGALYLPSGTPFLGELVEESGGAGQLYQQSAQLAAERARALRLSNVETDFVAKLIYGQPGTRNARFRAAEHALAVYQFFRDVGEAGIGVVLLSLAEFLGAYTPPVPQNAWAQRLDVARNLLGAYFESYDQIIDPPLLVRGGELVGEFDLAPGEIVGKALEAVREAQVLGEVENRKQALEFVRRWLEQFPEGSSQ